MDLPTIYARLKTIASNYRASGMTSDALIADMLDKAAEQVAGAELIDETERRAREAAKRTPLECMCGEYLNDGYMVWTREGDEIDLDQAEQEGLGDGDLFCCASCAREARCDDQAARWFEDAAYGRDD